MENSEGRMHNDLMQRPSDLLDRTKKFALATIKFCERLPKDETSRVLGRQLLRAGTSVGANYRAAHREKSKRNSSPKWELCWRRLMNQRIGSSYYRMQGKLLPAHRHRSIARRAS